MIIVETKVFTRLITELLTDEDYRRMQSALVLRPDQGALIRGAEGLRKLRWGQQGRGKRGGLRVFYFWDPAGVRIYMIYAIEKSRQADLSSSQARALGRVIREELS